MTIYIDVLLILNFVIDLTILLTVSVLLKRNIKIFNLLLGSFIGSLTIIIVFLNLSKIELFLLKTYISIIMVLITFKKTDIKFILNNLICFYIVSFLLGGFLYSVKLQTININKYFLFLFTPVIIFVYIWQFRNTKKRNNYYKIKIFIGKTELDLIGYLDTGNNLIDQTTKKIVIISSLKNTFKRKKYYIPYKTITESGLLECINVDALEIKNVGRYKHILLGFSNNINIEGVDVLLNNKLEGINDN